MSRFLSFKIFVLSHLRDVFFIIILQMPVEQPEQQGVDIDHSEEGVEVNTRIDHSDLDQLTDENYIVTDEVSCDL